VKMFPDCDPATILRDWKTSLDIIIEEAKNVKVCQWIAK